MTVKLISLNNKLILDDGTVIGTYDYAVLKLLDGLPIKIKIENNPDIEKYNNQSKNKIETWETDGNIVGPNQNTYEWNIPEHYKKINVEELVFQKFIDKQLTNEEYENRLVYELTEMKKRNMFPLLQCLCYIIDQFKQNNIIWGVGRGSSCASLVLFVLDINKIDPILYDIPINEFLK